MEGGDERGMGGRGQGGEAGWGASSLKYEMLGKQLLTQTWTDPRRRRAALHITAVTIYGRIPNLRLRVWGILNLDKSLCILLVEMNPESAIG